MSKKTFLIILFIGVLFLAAVAAVSMKSLYFKEVPEVINETVTEESHQPVVASTTTTSSIAPVELDILKQNDLIKSPATITGKIPGSWTFEGSFPIAIEDDSGNVLGKGIGTLKANWMTTDPVPFEAKITFKKTNADSGFIVFKKDNPSGKPENDQSVRLPVLFKIYLQ